MIFRVEWNGIGGTAYDRELTNVASLKRSINLTIKSYLKSEYIGRMNSQ